MAKAEFIAPHTFAFAGAFFVTAAPTIWITRGLSELSVATGPLAVVVAVMLLALLAAAFYSLGCAWGGVSRPRGKTLAFACGVLTATGLLLYAALDGSFPPPSDLEEAQQQYTRGTIGLAYAILAPVVAGLICAWISKRAR